MLTAVLHDLRTDILEHVFAVGAPFEILDRGPHWLWHATEEARQDLLAEDWHTAMRLLRARLSLAIRAVLRADRGDVGPEALVTECVTCGHRVMETDCASLVCAVAGCGGYAEAVDVVRLRITPLWQRARRS
jgi:hypothetical protein